LMSKGKGSKASIRPILISVASNPTNFLQDEDLKDLASAIISSRERLEEECKAYAHNPYSTSVSYKVWGRGDIDDNTIDQLKKACSIPVAVQGACMPDGHLGYGLNIGGVLATYNSVIPYGVGVDISCRMRLSILDLPPDRLNDVFSPKVDPFIRALQNGSVFGIGGNVKFKNKHPVMDMDWDICRTTKAMKDRAWFQLGTSGSGNHFVEFGIVTLEKKSEELDLEPGVYIALLSHSGSRGTGAEVCRTYTDIAKGKLPKQYEEFKDLAWLSLDSEAGQEYWNAMNLMAEYAKGNHDIIHQRV